MITVRNLANVARLNNHWFRVLIKRDKNENLRKIYNQNWKFTISQLKYYFFSLGRPVPQVTWWHDNVPLNKTSIQIIDNRKVISTLHLGKLERHALHNSYVCQSSNNEVTAPLTSSITLDLNCEYMTNFNMKKLYESNYSFSSHVNSIQCVH